MDAYTAQKWNSGEYGYCCTLVHAHGDSNVGRDPKTVANYLRLQASSAFRDADKMDGSLPTVFDQAMLYQMAARLGAAATAINCDARNNHAPDWVRALAILDVVDGLQWIAEAV